MNTEVLKNIRDLLPSIRARRQEIEEGRRMPKDLVDDLRKTGIFALGVPRDTGGREASPLEMMEAVESVASADGSAGWCAMIATGCNVSAGYMSPQGAREVFANPTAPM